MTPAYTKLFTHVGSRELAENMVTCLCGGVKGEMGQKSPSARHQQDRNEREIIHTWQANTIRLCMQYMARGYDTCLTERPVHGQQLGYRPKTPQEDTVVRWRPAVPGSNKAQCRVDAKGHSTQQPEHVQDGCVVQACHPIYSWRIQHQPRQFRKTKSQNKKAHRP